MSIPKSEIPEKTPDQIAFQAFVVGGDQEDLMAFSNQKKKEKDLEEAAEEKKEREHDFLVQTLTYDEIFAYDTPEMKAYDNYVSDEDWLDFADQAEENLFQDTQQTVMIDPLSGAIIVGRMNAEGLPEYFKMTDNGPQQIYDKHSLLGEIPQGAETFDSGVSPRVFQRPNEKGEIEFVTSAGQPLDQAAVKKLNDALVSNGMGKLETLACDYQKFLAHKQEIETVEKNESSMFAAKDGLKEAQEALAANYTRENLILVEERKIALREAGIEAKLDAGGHDLAAENKLYDDLAKISEDKLKIVKVRDSLLGKSPEEADAIMTASFGKRYDPSLVKSESNAFALERTGMNAAREGSVIASPFNVVAAGTQPAVAPTLQPGAPEWKKNNNSFMNTAPAASVGAQPGG